MADSVSPAHLAELGGGGALGAGGRWASTLAKREAWLGPSIVAEICTQWRETKPENNQHDGVSGADSRPGSCSLPERKGRSHATPHKEPASLTT